jgi:RimJ/RimL family protein N-acetyltransferase
MPAKPELKTARLVGRPVRPSDITDWPRTVDADSGVSVWLTEDGEPADEGFTQAKIEAFIRHWDKHGFGAWIFRDSRGNFVGYAAATFTSLEGPRRVQLRYAVRSDERGKGYATEMSKAILEFLFKQKGLNEIIGFTLTDNIASCRVMEKCGFRSEGQRLIAGGDQVLYRWRREPTCR